MPLMLAMLAGVAAQSQKTASVIEADLSAGRNAAVSIAYEPVARKEGHRGNPAGEPLALPATAPALPKRGSRMSPLMRARDLFDLGRYPARAVAKLYRLNADGSRSPAACTAQFIGPRHLLTAGHCLADRSKGVMHPGFELAIGFDAGSPPVTPVRVTRAWLPSDQLRLTDPKLALVTPERCSDWGVVAIAEPAGARQGWIGLRDAPMPGAVLHRFSYPHQSAADTLAASPPPTPQARRMVETMIAESRVKEADFSPTSLYYEYGEPAEVLGRYVADRNGYVLPGRSGSVLLDADGAAVAVLSRTYSGTTYSCRLTADDIGLIQAITRR